MMRNFQKKFNILIFSICLIIGLIRMNQIHLYQASVHQPTMSGAFALFSYIFVSTCLIGVSLLFDDINHNKLQSNVKITLKAIVLIIGLSLVCFSLLLSH